MMKEIMSAFFSGPACVHKCEESFITGENAPYHKHGFYEVHLFIKGHATIYIEDKCYKPSNGDLFIYRVGQLHRCVITENSPYDRILLYLVPELLQGLSTPSTSLMKFDEIIRKTDNNAIHLSGQNLEDFIHTADIYIDSFKTDKNDVYGNDFVRFEAFTKLLLLINSYFGEPGKKEHKNIMPSIVSDTMNYIENYIENHITETITLDELGKAVGYSPGYISTQFKYHTGLTIREYILDKRIELSRILLLEGKSVSEACLLAGFNDYANFIRSFTGKIGISPGKYKKENR